jgi:hypothetical protein
VTGELQKIRTTGCAGFENSRLKMLLRDAEPMCAIRIHLFGAGIHFTFRSLTLACELRRGEVFDSRASRERDRSAVLVCQELAMKTWIGAAIIAGTLALAGSAAIDPAAAASPKAGASAAAASTSTDLSARRYYRHYRRYAYRPYYQPYYYGRPAYYRPYPYYAPAPFFLGFGFGPWGW